jgi:hypothetical protein
LLTSKFPTKSSFVPTKIIGVKTMWCNSWILLSTLLIPQQNKLFSLLRSWKSFCWQGKTLGWMFEKKSI